MVASYAICWWRSRQWFCIRLVRVHNATLKYIMACQLVKQFCYVTEVHGKKRKMTRYQNYTQDIHIMAVGQWYELMHPGGWRQYMDIIHMHSSQVLYAQLSWHCPNCSQADYQPGDILPFFYDTHSFEKRKKIKKKTLVWFEFKLLLFCSGLASLPCFVHASYTKNKRCQRMADSSHVVSVPTFFVFQLLYIPFDMLIYSAMLCNAHTGHFVLCK